MFENTGRKIKDFAYILFVIGVIASLITGIFFIRFSSFVVFGIIIGGIISSYISSLFIYGFGKLVENSDKLVEQGEKKDEEEIEEIDEEEAIRTVKKMSLDK